MPDFRALIWVTGVSVDEATEAPGVRRVPRRRATGSLGVRYVTVSSKSYLFPASFVWSASVLTLAIAACS